MIQLKRVYEEPSKQDGLRILVERLWPRGVSKAKAAIDLWLKPLARMIHTVCRKRAFLSVYLRNHTQVRHPKEA